MTEAKTASARWRSALTAARAPRLLGDALLALTWLLGIAFGLCAAIIALLVADGTITRWNWPGSSRLGRLCSTRSYWCRSCPASWALYAGGVRVEAARYSERSGGSRRSGSPCSASCSAVSCFFCRTPSCPCRFTKGSAAALVMRNYPAEPSAGSADCCD